MKNSLIFSLFLFTFLCGCRSDRGARITFKLEDIPFFISEPIEYVELSHNERIVVPISSRDSDSLNEVFKEMENTKVNVFIGDRFYSEIRMIGGEDYSVLNLPYLSNAREIFRSEGVEFKN